MFSLLFDVLLTIILQMDAIDIVHLEQTCKDGLRVTRKVWDLARTPVRYRNIGSNVYLVKFLESARKRNDVRMVKILSKKTKMYSEEFLGRLCDSREYNLYEWTLNRFCNNDDDDFCNYYKSGRIRDENFIIEMFIRLQRKLFSSYDENSINNQLSIIWCDCIPDFRGHESFMINLFALFPPCCFKTVETLERIMDSFLTIKKRIENEPDFSQEIVRAVFCAKFVPDTVIYAYENAVYTSYNFRTVVDGQLVERDIFKSSYVRHMVDRDKIFEIARKVGYENPEGRRSLRWKEQRYNPNYHKLKYANYPLYSKSIRMASSDLF